MILQCFGDLMVVDFICQKSNRSKFGSKCNSYTTRFTVISCQGDACTGCAVDIVWHDSRGVEIVVVEIIRIFRDVFWSQIGMEQVCRIIGERNQKGLPNPSSTTAIWEGVPLIPLAHTGNRLIYAPESLSCRCHWKL